MAVTAEVRNWVGRITLELMTTGRTVTFASEDAREDMTASNEKRAPGFTGG
jgi:hypothetical protein